MRFRFTSTSTTLTFHHVAGFTDVARILHEAVGQLRHMHQAVLVDADIDKRAEVGDVGHDFPSRSIPRHQVGNLLDAVLKTAVLNSGRGSRPGFSNSPRMMFTVGTPN